ncbi:MAG: ComEC/Rec2 family competence protein, partial [Candidatus Paceibacterota bacterium]
PPALYSFKHSFMLNIERLIPEPQVGLGEGLLLGVKRALGEDLERTFRQTGIIHIVVLSGYNVMIVVTFILFILGAIFGRRLSSVFGIIGIILFALLVGLGATVVRASLMASLLLVMGFTGRIYLAIRGLFLAGALMVIWNPYSLVFDIGFQLSFLATLGLILFSPYLSKQLSIVPNLIGMREFVVATLATQLFVLPLLLYQMGEFSVVAVIVNVMVLPMVAVAMLLTFLTGIISFLSSSLALPFAYVAHLSLSYIIIIAEWFGALSFAAFSVPPFSVWFVPLGYAAIAGLLWQLNREPNTLKGWQIVEEVESKNTL